VQLALAHRETDHLDGGILTVDPRSRVVMWQGIPGEMGCRTKVEVSFDDVRSVSVGEPGFALEFRKGKGQRMLLIPRPHAQWLLQERKVRPVGADSEYEIDVRVIAATNRELTREVAAGRFRADLFYRVNVLRIDVPPLRERHEDVLALAQHFLERQRSPARPELRFSAAALRKLLDYDWPGNVRELENCVARVVALTRHDEIGIDDLPQTVRSTRTPKPTDVVEDSDLITLDEMERRYIRAVLQACRGNKSQAARVLGMDRRALYRRISALHIE